jgi:hypothetical protein
VSWRRLANPPARATRNDKRTWDKPSGALIMGEIAGVPIAFLSRHEKGHRLSPSDFNYRARELVLRRRQCWHRIRCRRGCAFILPRRRRPKASVSFATYVCMEGPAILRAGRKPHSAIR